MWFDDIKILRKVLFLTEEKTSYKTNNEFHYNNNF